MANEKVHEIPIANVARVEVVTEEHQRKDVLSLRRPTRLRWKRSSPREEEKELRKLNRLIAQLRTGVKGCAITEASTGDIICSELAIVDGGQARSASIGALAHDGPTMGEEAAARRSR